MLHFTLANERQNRQIQHAEGPIVFGRLPQADCASVAVEDPYTSRDQLRIEELSGGLVRLQNLGAAVTLPGGAALATGDARTALAPIRVLFGCTTLDIVVKPAENALGTSLQTIARPQSGGGNTLLPRQLIQAGRIPTSEQLAQWFELLMTVQRKAANSNEFYADTARAVVELVGLDRGLVLLRQGDAWETIAGHARSAEDAAAGNFSRSVLAQVMAERRTYFQSFQNDNQAQSLLGIEAVVASPIFDEHDAVAGVVYGSRDMRAAAGLKGIEPLEAQFVQLLAGAVSTGLARLAREADAARSRVQFEEFFSPELARALERDRTILSAQERELTMLFADLRGFSRLAERIGPSETYQLLADVLDRLTDRIMDQDGVVIDYYGDGLAAMWNAPADVAGHADRACQAALAIFNELPAINSSWAEKLGGLLRLGIGIHTGRAEVGNSGSKRRLKYGPRGHAVNLTSRLEAATKVLGVPCLVSEATHSQLAWQTPFRRVCRARLTGMTEPVHLFELPSYTNHPTWLARRERYEAALKLYEEQRIEPCREACRAMQIELGVSDGPTNWLLRQAEQRLAAETAGTAAVFDPVFAVETK